MAGWWARLSSTFDLRRGTMRDTVVHCCTDGMRMRVRVDLPAGAPRHQHPSDDVLCPPRVVSEGTESIWVLVVRAPLTATGQVGCAME